MASATATKRRTRASKNGAVNKAEEIRKAAKEIGGTKVRPKQVIELLAKRGIEVTSPQVSSTLKAAGYARTRRGKGKSAAPSNGHEPTGLTIEHLVAAKALADKIGSVKAAQKALEAIAKLV